MFSIDERVLMDNDYHVYFVWRDPQPHAPFRVVYRQVKTRTRKGTPITYEWRSSPDAYETWETAKYAADKLNEAGTGISAAEWIRDD